MLAAAGAWLAPAAPAQTTDDVRAHYVKREVFIPMRDGVKLFTARAARHRWGGQVRVSC